MCGITGWIEWKQYDEETKKKIILSMIETLKPRGPDSINFWLSNYCSLGHSRLIIIDPLGGKQPMIKIIKEKTYVLVYNGELYNTEEIRKELINKGYTFESYSDTEVVLTAYIEWKEDCLKYFNGIYAIAIWVEPDNSLFLARDRVGVKPLFYSFLYDEKSNNINGIIFGSEIKALLKHPKIKPIVDFEGLRLLFGFGIFRPIGTTPLKGIYELKPAYALKFNKENRTSIWRYWNLETKIHPDNFEETVKKIHFLVKDSVERQLVSDVARGCLLSGGLDSSAICSISNRKILKDSNNKEKLKTFSLLLENYDKYFESNIYRPSSDIPYCKLMSEKLQSEHYWIHIKNEELIEHLEETVKARDLPGAGDMDTSLLLMFKEIKKNATMILSGECSDEIFGGYDWMHQDTMFPWLKLTGNFTSMLKKEWLDKLDLENFMKEKYNEYMSEMPKSTEDDITIQKEREKYWKILWFMYLLLERKDRMSMRYSVEVRVPFADHRILEYVWNVPPQWKVMNDEEKILLKRAFEIDQILPEEIIKRKKSPYPSVNDPNYTLLLIKKFEEKIMNDDHLIIWNFFDKEKIENYLNQQKSNLKAPSVLNFISGIYQFIFWFKEYSIEIDKPILSNN
jgi:asparagine synthase (glutamine-hydrolysing)